LAEKLRNCNNTKIEHKSKKKRTVAIVDNAFFLALSVNDSTAYIMTILDEPKWVETMALENPQPSIV